MRQALKHELYARYLAQPSLESQVLKQLDYQRADMEFAEFTAEVF